MLLGCYTTGSAYKMIDCSNKDVALEKSNIYAMRKLGKKGLKECELSIKEELNYYEFSYVNKANELDSLRKGGIGIIFKISKKNCEIYDIIRLQ